MQFKGETKMKKNINWEEERKRNPGEEKWGENHLLKDAVG